MDPVTLRTRRLLLSPQTAADIDQIVAYAQDPDIIAYTPVPMPYGPAEAAQFVETVRAGWAAGDRCEFAIRSADAPDRVLGAVSLFGIADGSAETGWVLAPWARGQGFMTEAVHRVLDWGFAPAPDGLGLVRVQWRALDGNAASTAVARRTGFRYEGRQRSASLHRGERHDVLTAAVLGGDPRTTATVWPD